MDPVTELLRKDCENRTVLERAALSGKVPMFEEAIHLCRREGVSEFKACMFPDHKPSVRLVAWREAVAHFDDLSLAAHASLAGRSVKHLDQQT